jgi:hypothetical protein
MKGNKMRTNRRGRPSDRGIEFHWGDMCRTLRVFGIMEDYSVKEIWRIRKLLVEAISAGKVEQVRRGVYRRIILEGQD